MKNRVKEKLDDIEQKYRDDDGIRLYEDEKAEIDYNKALERLTVIADGLIGREIGFVSTFKGFPVYLRRKVDVELTKEEFMKKRKKIAEEYALAMEVNDIIRNIRENLVKFKTPIEISIALNVCLTSIDKALNGCITKGYNVPAVLILSEMAQLPLYDYDETIGKYIKKIAANYAKKSMYDDNGICIKGCNRAMETDIFYLKNAMEKGALGETFKTPESIKELDKYYNHVIQSAAKCGHAEYMASKGNISELGY